LKTRLAESDGSFRECKSQTKPHTVSLQFIE
jgi:hypothetical protein